MFIINILAFVIVLLAISYKFKVSLVEGIPLVISGMALVLYALAFIRRLMFIDFIGIGIIIAVAVVLMFNKPQIRKDIIENAINEITKPSFVIFVILMSVITILVQGKLVNWWDDYNFWATDVKSIYFRNGFAPKYQNVAPEFGDYPPGTQLIKWWFLHFDTSNFEEGLMFAGYYFIIYGFLAPFLHFFDASLKDGISNWLKGFIKVFAAGIFLLFLPTTVEAFFVDGCCADLCMALAYGSFLIYMLKNRDCRIFDYVSATLFLSFMVLCKNSSFIWFALSFVFGLVIILLRKREIKDRIKALALVYLLPILCLGSWYLFCLINRRVAKLTSNSIKMLTGNMNVPQIKGELVDSFFNGFFWYPMHRYNNWIIDISPFFFYVIAVAGLVFFSKKYMHEAKERTFVAIFLPVSGLIFYGITLVCHLTVFATEEQYLEPFAMVSSIERYSCPFSIGIIMVIMYLVISNKSSQRTHILEVGAFALFVILCCDPTAIGRGFITYKENTASIIEERDMLLNDEIRELESNNNCYALMRYGRILYVRDMDELSWISHAYLSFELSPVSMVYDYTEIDENGCFDEEAVFQMAKNYHADTVLLGGEFIPVP